MPLCVLLLTRCTNGHVIRVLKKDKIYLLRIWVSNEAKDTNRGEGKLKYDREKDEEETKVHQHKMLTKKGNLGG